jgi:hypothetical protein
MDAHTRYPNDYLALGVRRLQRGDTKWVSGPQIASGDGPVSRAISLALRTPLGRGASRRWAAADNGHGDEYELDSGVFDGVWERQTLLDYGGWDEGWLRNQDSEMAGRFLLRGERLVCVRAMAGHYRPRNSLRGLWRQYLQYGEYREKTAVRHPHTLRRSHLFAPSVVLTCVAAVLPTPMRSPARAGLVFYLAVVGGGSLSVARHAERRVDAALVPLVLVVMHLAHGTGAILGALRYGPPVAGIDSAFRRDRPARRGGPDPEPVFAPSLRLEPSSVR